MSIPMREPTEEEIREEEKQSSVDEAQAEYGCRFRLDETNMIKDE